MDMLQHHLAHTLKTHRRERGWSLAQAAEATGVSKAMLGQIERGESSPTIATLWKIATGFNLPFSAFIEPLAVDRAAPRRQQQLQGYSPADNTMQALPLFPFDAALNFEMLVVELAPGASSESSAHEPGVIEHVIVIEGELELQVAAQWQSLAPGEGVRFNADRAHAYRNPGIYPVRFYDLIHYPPR
ncbi:helix-turn-helix domain-containing protein [Erwinia sorbitola]|uniref:Helix-turn-helix domain-containing protein n=1 Tax=Erwinia sorbitola TaxID=2681984 RepID=A0A6I6ETW4_9GAMM|nr:XRE family transcriptional regulator [Erwinia sorbitola]MTD25471.1 helix-turn-helix domain-containing protein [Erwinia sorbitola]QGU87962.1 helix-turn-helix domain-containing protein [Erwinia sorbitola]